MSHATQSSQWQPWLLVMLGIAIGIAIGSCIARALAKLPTPPIIQQLHCVHDSQETASSNRTNQPAIQPRMDISRVVKRVVKLPAGPA